ncbi:hypothetical protein GCM10009678_36780 [Actinomadura kijaniata]
MISQAVTGGVAACLVVLMALGPTSLRGNRSGGSGFGGGD